MSSYNWINHLMGYTLHTVWELSFLYITINHWFVSFNFSQVPPRSILFLEVLSPCSPQSHDVHWAWRKLCPTHPFGLQAPTRVLGAYHWLPWHLRRDSHLYSCANDHHASPWMAILSSHKCHGLSHVPCGHERLLCPPLHWMSGAHHLENSTSHLPRLSSNRTNAGESLHRISDFQSCRAFSTCMEKKLA